jgi:Ser-tRNA(Ala) deacylase AlaX
MKKGVPRIKVYRRNDQIILPCKCCGYINNALVSVHIDHIDAMTPCSKFPADDISAVDGIEYQHVHKKNQRDWRAFCAFLTIRLASSGSLPIGSAYTSGM